MLSLFPFALWFGVWAPTLLRLALTASLLNAAWKHLESHQTQTRFLGIAESLAGVLILVGLWTQAASLAAAIIAGIWFFFPIKTYPVSTILQSFAIALSLILLGAGRLAFDLPF